MPVVAIAGGTGGIGRPLVQEIVADGKSEVLVLSRKADPGLGKTLGARILPVDYSDLDTLVAVLEDNRVDTLISALSARAPPDQEHSLIQAAERSTITKRYIPSVWGVKFLPEDSWFPIAATKLAIFDALEKTDLEWTVVSNGFFLDYWGIPKIESYLAPVTVVVDIAGKKAAIPGSGDKPVVFTYTRDVGKFTAKLVTLDKWEPVSYIVGERLTWGKFVQVAEEVMGEKFEVTHDSVELLQSGKVTELPSHVHAYPYFPKEALQATLSQFAILFEKGVFDFQPEQTLNDLFPEIKPKSVRDVLTIGWKE
ncbi:hypothetical protein EDB81DRAFT_632928 [Dactylonectria macrodidyma]|uniref:NmrA-like domain-containing protein n=1 Tax=Dactylonectria macrodidyma TaxID=307937 RepID=A0A9P9JJ15_9HYPO|nr:hypothetical protein EDB81DRAFT_632928 [Dactylonectria macrodidyma]